MPPTSSYIAPPIQTIIYQQINLHIARRNHIKSRRDGITYRASRTRADRNLHFVSSSFFFFLVP